MRLVGSQNGADVGWWGHRMGLVGFWGLESTEWGWCGLVGSQDGVGVVLGYGITEWDWCGLVQPTAELFPLRWDPTPGPSAPPVLGRKEGCFPQFFVQRSQEYHLHSQRRGRIAGSWLCSSSPSVFSFSPASSTLSCSDITCKERERCKMVEGGPTCVQETFSTCWVIGGPHYKTFDGKIFDFMGTCTYTLSKTCGTAANLPFFTVEVRNSLRGNAKSPYIDAVTVQAYNITVVVIRSENGFVRVCEEENNREM